MGQFTYVIKDTIGLHARPAGLLVKLVKEAGSAVLLKKGEKEVSADRLMAVMGLGVKHGDEVTVTSDDEAALDKVRSFFEENL